MQYINKIRNRSWLTNIFRRSNQYAFYINANDVQVHLHYQSVQSYKAGGYLFWRKFYIICVA